MSRLRSTPSRLAPLVAVATLCCLLLPSLGATPASAASSARLPVIYNIAAAAPSQFAPDAPPPGANDWSCKPSAAHPRPVILVEGTFATMGENWATLSPLLKDNGYCVFALNYGATKITQETDDHVYAIGAVATSAAQLGAFVDKVLAATGAAQVDLVGHSQGGMMPNYYLKFLGGAPKVHTLVALAPSNHGTTLDGLVTLEQTWEKAFPGLASSFNQAFNSPDSQGLGDQEVGSAFLQKLNSLPDTVPGVSYTVIATKYDEVVTPYTSQFLAGPGVHNITLQNQCFLDFADHVSIAFDHIALQDVLNALDPSHAHAAACTPVLPVVGG